MIEDRTINFIIKLIDGWDYKPGVKFFEAHFSRAIETIILRSIELKLKNVGRI